ncbi:hypothetical protein KKC63_03060 [Patescibacteria group bacterium]|nr:hypothetical protein [Patescibacteria group bacterium]MBU4023382.1 hypothetical protein [Patescibacteria group bacterium]MBU4078251.1 hypothetical protein [Patescibacteria group bacterium]
MEEKRTLLTDFDGTIARLSLPWCFYKLMSQYRLIVLPLMCVLLPITAPLYLMRPGIKQTLKELEQCRRNSWQIVVMSATEDNWIWQKLMLSWLKIHKVTIDELELRPKGMATLEFKLSLVEKYKPERIFDDARQVIGFLCRCLSATSGFSDYTLTGRRRFVLGLERFTAYDELHIV